MYTLGIDIGSAASKAAVLKDGKTIAATAIVPYGTGTTGPEEVYQKVLRAANLNPGDIKKVVATGYGRMRFSPADKQYSELVCHAAGVHFLQPQVRTIIDIGGQDIKVLRLDAEGTLCEFVMNDKCAAGTGRSLDLLSRTLNVPVERMGDLDALADRPLQISSTCIVFAESEIISHLSNGASQENVIAGMHRSIAKRVSGLAYRLGLEETVAMSGGVALNQGVVRALADELQVTVHVHESCQLAGAIGAALLAGRQ